MSMYNLLEILEILSKLFQEVYEIIIETKLMMLMIMLSDVPDGVHGVRILSALFRVLSALFWPLFRYKIRIVLQFYEVSS